MKLATKIFFFFLTLNLLTTGGRLPSSDENALFLLTESIATRGAFDVPPGIVNNVTEWQGKYYIWYEPGQALLSVPHYLVGLGVARLTGLSPDLLQIFLKAVVGTVNAVVGAFLGLFVFLFAQRLGYNARVSFLLSVGVCVGSFVFPFFKQLIREPLLALCLLAASYYVYRWKEEPTQLRWQWAAGAFCALGILAKFTFALNVPFFLLFIYVVSLRLKEHKNLLFRASSAFLLASAVGGFGILLYNFLRFGDPFMHGVGGGTTFPTPLLVGLYGLLLSPGKSLFLFAPLTLLGLFGFRYFFEREKELAWMWIGLVVVNLILHAKYIAWGGDGSWGPRYLAILVPMLTLPVGELLSRGDRIWKTLVSIFLALGIFIQIGGVSIYTGNYLRKIEEYPYKKGFDHPEFLTRAHYIPNYSPVYWHWKMLIENVGEHLSGNLPRIDVAKEKDHDRIPLLAEQQHLLLRTIDYWFCYPFYISKGSLIFVLVPLLMAGIVAGLATHIIRRTGIQSSHVK